MVECVKARVFKPSAVAGVSTEKAVKTNEKHFSLARLGDCRYAKVETTSMAKSTGQ